MNIEEFARKCTQLGAAREQQVTAIQDNERKMCMYEVRASDAQKRLAQIDEAYAALIASMTAPAPVAAPVAATTPVIPAATKARRRR